MGPADIVFLLEHKSYRDSELLRQFLNYQNRIYSESENPVIPILIYHGKEPEWKYSLSFQDSLKMTDDIRRFFGGEIFDFRFRLLNLNKLDIRQTKDLPTNPILFALTKIWKLEEEELGNLFKFCKDGKGGEKVGMMALNYLNQYDSDKFSWERLVQVEARVFPNEGDRLVEKLKEPFDFGLEKGIEKGREEGLRKLAVEMLADGESMDKICKYTKLTKKQIEALKKQSKKTD